MNKEYHSPAIYRTGIPLAGLLLTFGAFYHFELRRNQEPQKQENQEQEIIKEKPKELEKKLEKIEDIPFKKT